MARPYSEDIRARVVARVEGGASCREAAEHFDICHSSAIKWMKRVETTGSFAAKPMGGGVSPLDRHKKELLALIAETPDATLDEIVQEMHRRKLPGSRTSLWRFLDRHGITLKKNTARERTRAA